VSDAWLILSAWPLFFDILISLGSRSGLSRDAGREESAGDRFRAVFFSTGEWGETAGIEVAHLIGQKLGVSHLFPAPRFAKRSIPYGETISWRAWKANSSLFKAIQG
jgi:hypothetical protein